MSSPNPEESSKKLESYRKIVRTLSRNDCLDAAGPTADSSLSWDLPKLEKESEQLATAAAKKLHKSGKGKTEKTHSKGFLSWISTWRRKREIVKVQTMFESLVPKLRTTEEEVRLWLIAVSVSGL
jgi:hypothetical protein